ncbi:MAG: hypothetical protein IKC37_03855 [Clostridia bacterium]|nr:hypothetical protein [Clostridia bacterium]
MKDDLAYVKYWDVYAPLLTERQQKIGDLYFNYDLSLGEIAEQLSVSRQSVYDCLQTTKGILLDAEKKLGVCKAQEVDEARKQAYAQREDAFLDAALGEEAQAIKAGLAALRKEMGVEW